MLIEKKFDLLHATYDTDTGIFRSLSLQRPNHILGWVNDNGYVIIRTGPNRTQRAHRLAWMFVHGDYPKLDIDHINGIRDDNRLCNLREVSRSENMQNLSGHHRDSKIKSLGVAAVQGKYFYSRIMVKGESKYLGCFKTREEAHEAYMKAKKELHPFHAR